MVGDRHTGNSYTSGKHFNNVTASAFWTVEGSKGGVTKVKASEAWLNSYKRITAMGDGWIISDDRTYLNHDDKDINGKPQLYWNSYIEPKWDEVDTKDYLPVFIDHIEYLIPDKEDQELFFQWLAERFQYPLDRARFTPLHISPNQGTGRGWIVRLIQDLMGTDNTSSTKMSELAGKGSQFNEYLYNNRFCSIHEVYEDRQQKYEIDTKIRSTLTEAYLPINTKFGVKGQMRVYTSLFLMSNHRDCLILSNQDRRIWVIEGFVNPRSAEYYNKLYGMLNNKQFLREVYWYLKRLDISKIRGISRSPNTDSKARLVGAGLSEIGARFKMLLDAPPGLVWTGRLAQVYINFLNGRNNPDYIIRPIDRGDPDHKTSMEIKALCRSELIGAYKGFPLRIIDSDSDLNLAGHNTFRIRVHPNFPEEYINNSVELKSGLLKTCKAVRRLIDGEDIEAFREFID